MILVAFTMSTRDEAAQNFTMPALSPTMTEGNISAWRVKEGASFSAGDVLLEIETDKATMDVEAQDDGILVMIVAPDDSKGVKVGKRIGVTAEAGDDISSLEIPQEEESGSTAPSKEISAPKEEVKKAESSEKQAEAPQSSKPKEEAAAKQGGRAQKQKYPLYPAVQHLLHLNGLSKADAESIPASGPAGRLLKGDVLAYLGKIAKDYPASAEARITKLSHLDLSNIQIAATPKPQEAPKAEAPAVPELPQATEVALPISLSAVLATQKRVQESLGISLPLSTFIARASELANEDLPRSRNYKPTAEDLFNSVLGLGSIPASTRGNYMPMISSLASASRAASRRPAKEDILDLLTSATPSRKVPAPRSSAAGMEVGGPNVFSVAAKNGEERRAQAYLERMKLVLETEPGKLVL
jgi:pyruvate/2-oxoglutarate dehydrogenase complex dihydrolipoamide acyltransferase (E2) component